MQIIQFTGVKKRICQEVPLKFDNTDLRPGTGIDSNLREEHVVSKWSGFRKNFADCQELEGKCKHVAVFDLIPYQISGNISFSDIKVSGSFELDVFTLTIIILYPD